MSGSLLRRSTALIIALAGALSLSGTAHAATPRTSYQVSRASGNQCGSAVFQYTYTARGDGFYNIKISDGYFGWRSDLDKCGLWGVPYAPVLQWQADTDTEGHFDWTVYAYGGVLDDFVGSGFKNVRFRVCNWNTDTDYIGTCGSS
jgi:hypothetical protein